MFRIQRGHERQETGRASIVGESSDGGRQCVDDKRIPLEKFHLQYPKLSDGGTAVSYAPVPKRQYM